MIRDLRAIAAACLVTAGCSTLATSPGCVTDSRGNLTGDRDRTFLDIVESGVEKQGNGFAFYIRTAAPLPDARAMTEGKRADYVWFVDADRNVTTGQSELGNDINLHVWIDETGWHSAVFPVTDIGKAQGDPPPVDACPFEIEADTVTLRVPDSVFPALIFDWWAWSTTQNAGNWEPVTENPPTKRTPSDSRWRKGL
ncbi:MAG: hypothetical protein AMXMBFR84_05920 [Candidatus Hydrogenedentota bacterium]